VPHLGAATAIGASAIGEAAVAARWRIGSETLTLALNLGDAAVPLEAPSGETLHIEGAGLAADGLQPASLVAWLG
jgi:maltooligosyltrehalose trehalohydrolase